MLVRLCEPKLCSLLFVDGVPILQRLLWLFVTADDLEKLELFCLKACKKPTFDPFLLTTELVVTQVTALLNVLFREKLVSFLTKLRGLFGRLGVD